jgi:hypothetical protein
LQSRKNNMRWQIEYYHVTLFPGLANGSASENDKR